MYGPPVEIEECAFFQSRRAVFASLSSGWISPTQKVSILPLPFTCRGESWISMKQLISKTMKNVEFNVWNLQVKFGIGQLSC
jgi:hypothetical protein